MGRIQPLIILEGRSSVCLPGILLKCCIDTKCQCSQMNRGEIVFVPASCIPSFSPNANLTYNRGIKLHSFQKLIEGRCLTLNIP